MDMNTQGNHLRKKAVLALCTAQVRLCLGQTGMKARCIGPLTQIHIDPPLFWEIDAFYFDNLPPAMAVAAVRACQPDPKHALLTFTQEPDLVASTYANLGYQHSGSMPVMCKVLTNEHSSPPNFLVERVTDRRGVQQLNESGLRMPPSHLHDPELRYYFIEDKGIAVCWGRAFYTSHDLIYVSAVATLPTFRRRGFATMLMQTIHADAAAAGMTASILCASEEAYALYTKLGYQTIMSMLELAPKAMPDQ